MDDEALLSEYARTRSEDAFCAIVDRYGGMVYHAAQRRTGNAETAKDIAQAVFLALSQKAGSLRMGTSLAGWLFRATAFATNTLLRDARRRTQREQEMARMAESMQVHETGPLWEEMAHNLDDAIAQLPAKDREILLQRFFAGRTHREVASAIGISEDVAKMRISRAVEKLRHLLVGRGVAVSSAALLLTLSTHAAEAAPLGVKAVLTSTVLGKTFIASTTLETTEGVLKLMAFSKLKAAAAIGTALLMAGGGTVLFVNHLHSADATAELRNSPASIPADRTTPKGCLLLMSAAMETGDVDKYVNSFIFATPDEMRVKAGLVDLVGSARIFMSTLTNKFGPESLPMAMANLPLGIVPTHLVVAANESIRGAKASVDVSKSGRAIELINMDGEWKASIEGMFRLKPNVIEEYCKRLSAALQSEAKQIGKYATAIEAINSVKQKAR